MENLKFKCPECEADRLEEVMTEVTVNTEITSIVVDSDGDEGDIDISYADQVNENGSVSHYQCYCCGYVLRKENRPICEETELVDWLKAHA